MMKGIVLTGTLVFLASVSLAADRLYSGSATSGDLASPANWSGGGLPDPRTDKAVFTSQDQNGNNSVLPSTGLTLSENLMLGAIEFNYRKTVPFDLNGKTLSFPDDNSYTVNINNHVKMTMGNGVVTNLSRLALNIGTELNLTNVTVYLRNPYVSQRYDSTLRVLKDAAVVFTTLPSDDQKFVNGENDSANTNPKTFIIDGGRVEARSSMPQWRRLVIGGRTNCLWHICNGGRFDDYSSAPNLFLRSSGSSLLISSGGELTQTNAVTAQKQYNDNIGLVLGGDIANGFVGVSNATLRTSRFNYLAKTENRCVFKDATVDLCYHGPDGAYASTTNASGLFFRAGSSKGEVLVTGEDGHFTADQVTFEKGSSDHSFSADGGNLTVRLIADSGEGNRLSFSGCTLNGGVQLKGQGGVVTFGDGAVCRMPTQDKGLQFANDVAQGSRLVVSNAQIECGGAFCGSCPTGGGSSIWACSASVYTNCPGSAIEFRGTSPCLKITSSWTRPNSGYWFCAAFGTFSEGVLGTSPLVHPLTLRFVLPETPYQQAPLQGDATTSSGGRPVVLAGNARIEVLSGDFHPTRMAYRMPLISDVNNFTQSKDADHVFFGLDIEALNRNNAETLPLGSRLVYVKEGQVGRIDIVFPRGFTLVLR